MNVFNTIFALRPEVDPMPTAERSRIRETLFGVGHDDATRSVRARSESGAVVSTAPHGTRATAPRSRRRRGSAFASALKGAVGIGAAVAAGVVVWSFVSDDEASTVSESAPSTAERAPAPTAAPTTAPPPMRTPVTLTEQLLVPEDQLTVDEVAIAPAAPGASSMLVSASDGSTMWLGDFDGDLAPVEGLDFEVVGSVGVGVASDRSPDEAVSYQFFIPCGLVLLIDAPGADPYRPEAVALFESMAFDGSSALNASMPDGFSIIDSGVWQASYTTRFQVPVDGATKSARLVQIPNGSLAQLTFGGRQLEPSSFAGEPAFVDAAPADPNMVSIFWQDADTAFQLDSTDMNVAELEAFVASLVATTPADWSERFSTPAPTAPDVSSSCAPQPSLGPSLDP